jgi:hypothetical protein
MRLNVLPLAVLLLLAAVGSADATVTVAIDLTHQRMHVVSSTGSHDWPISSARSGFYTPGGSFAPTRLERMHYSKKYHMSPMPYSIFFRGGYAIHGTYSVGELGRPASHGCVRLSPGNAATLYHMVQTEGASISISGTPPASRPFRREYDARRAVKRSEARVARAEKQDASVRAAAEDAEDRSRRVPVRVRRPYRTDPYESDGTYGYVVQPYTYSYGARPPESYTRDYISPPQ